MDYNKFTEEELQLCRQTDLVMVCERLGYRLKREGSVYTIPSMDSLKIFNRRTYTRFSDHTGGSCIDFLINVAGMDWKEAVEWLLDFNGQPHIRQTVKSENVGMPHMTKWFEAVHIPGHGYVIKEPKAPVQAPEEGTEKAEFILPQANVHNERVRNYLVRERCLSPATVDFFIGRGMVYESAKTHNVVFVGMDKDGMARHASLRGTYTELGYKPFKGSVTGSDTRYTFNLVNLSSDTLIVCEAPIDCMSCVELFDEVPSGKIRFNYLALTGTHDRSLERFLSEYDHIKLIVLALDADEPGQTACRKIKEKYTSGEWSERGFEIEIRPPEGYKDYNELLAAFKALEGICR